MKGTIQTGMPTYILSFLLLVTVWTIPLARSNGEISGVSKGPQALGIALENYAYPYPVQYFTYRIQGQDVRMGFMDVGPEHLSRKAQSPVVLLLHGKNFFGAYWSDTIAKLKSNTFRVVIPDLIGFGKSSKPDIPYSFHGMSSDLAHLLNSLGIERVAVIGHSMGGMLAVRFALLYPERTTHLVLENPIGLEDYREKVPYLPTEKVYQRILLLSEQQIRNYHRTYYVKWKSKYEKYVQVHYRWTLSGEYPRLARASAMTEQMIYEQPVCHEFHLIQPKTLLVIGQEDRTFLGRSRVGEKVAIELGQYPQLSRQAVRTIPNAELVELKGVGHIPHLAVPNLFHKAVLDFLVD